MASGAGALPRVPERAVVPDKRPRAGARESVQALVWGPDGAVAVFRLPVASGAGVLAVAALLPGGATGALYSRPSFPRRPERHRIADGYSSTSGLARWE